MSEEFNSVPLFTFKTLTNTELGAESARRTEDGSVVLVGVLKKVTETMLSSYPKTLLGKWTPNRLSVRYSPDDLAGRNFKRLDNGEALDVDGLLSLAG
ncbi:MAG: hypothetical protein CL908_02065 [Deltaproteobacteria bacterium]|jgi:hypothetical protein|nr:hypothetical protein [Deltaproteobacteria bacterium]